LFDRTLLLALLDRGACLPDLAEALDQRPEEITRAGRSLSMRADPLALRRQAQADATRNHQLRVDDGARVAHRSRRDLRRY